MMMGRMTLQEAREILGVGPCAGARDIRSAYKKLALIYHPDKMENSPESTKKFQQISAAYKRLSTDDDNDEMDIDEDYTFALFRKMFQAERQVIRINTEHGSFILLGPCYSSRRYAHSSDEEFDSSHYSFRKEEASKNAEDLISEESAAKKKADKKRMKKQRQRENRRQAKEDLQKQREEIKQERQKVHETKPAQLQKENKKENESKNVTKTKKKAEKGETQNNENQERNCDKSIKTLKTKYFSNISNHKTKTKEQTPISQTNAESHSSDEEIEEENDIDINCAFFAKTLQKKSAPVIKTKQPNDPPAVTVPATEKTVSEPKQQNQEIKPDEVKNQAPQAAPAKTNYQQIAMEGNKKAGEGKFVEAVTLFSQAISLSPTDHRIFGNRSYCFDKLRQFDRALIDAEKAINLMPKWSKGYFRKGRALFGLKKYEDAEAAFKQVLRIDRSCHDAETELYHIRVKRLQEMGFSKEQSVLAIRKYTTVEEALENVLSGTLPDPAEVDVYISDEEDEIYEEEEEQVEISTEFDVGPLPEKPIPERTSRSSLWIGNVTDAITESLLSRYFTQFGPIMNIKLYRSKSCAFVNFLNEDSAALALKENQYVEMIDTWLYLKYPDRRFVPNRMQDSRIRTENSNIPPRQLLAQKDGVKECYFWRNTGCHNGPKCRFLHIPENQGIDSNRRQNNY